MLKHKAAAVVLLTLFVANNYKAARACAQYNGFTVQTLQSVLNMPGGGVYGTIEAPNTAFYGLWNSDNPSPAFSAPYVQSVTGETDGSGKYQVLNGRAPAYWNFLIQSGPCDGDTTVIPGTTDENIPVVNGMITSLICEANTPVGGGVSISPSPITRESGKAYMTQQQAAFSIRQMARLRCQSLTLQERFLHLELCPKWIRHKSSPLAACQVQHWSETICLLSTSAHQADHTKLWLLDISTTIHDAGTHLKKG